MANNLAVFSFRKAKLLFSLLVIVLFFIPYTIFPYLYTYEKSPLATNILITITLICCLTILIFLNLPRINIPKSATIPLNFSKANRVIFIIFYFVIFVTFITAPSIPIIDSLIGGKSESELSAARESFLKTRQGWEQGLSYIVGMLSAYIIPYFIAFSHYHNRSEKWYYTGAFFLYCISFLEKAYFLKIGIPLLIIYLFLSKEPLKLLIKSLALVLVIFWAMYFLTGFEGTGSSNINEVGIFSTTFRASNTFEIVAWRAIVIPVVTAFDGINVFITDFNQSFFNGRTSSLIAFLTIQDRFNFERYLATIQFGGEGSANSNQVFTVEAYINFGYIGVLAFSILVAFFIRKAIHSRDICYVSVMPLFIYNLYNAGLIGILFSNGYILFFLFLLFFKIKNK